MKQSIDLSTEPLSEKEREFILLWKERKDYKDPNLLTLGEVIELCVAVTHNLHQDFSDGRFFDWILLNEESVIAWQGNELIDILFYEVRQGLKHRFITARTFPN